MAPALALALLLASGADVFAQPTPDISSVVDAFEQSRSQSDVDGSLAQFTDDAVVTIQSGRTTQVFAGRDQVRAYLQGIGPSHALMRSVYRVDGVFVRWTERDEDSSQTFDAIVQATVQNGRISTLLIQQTQAFASPTARTRPGAQTTRQPPSLAWALALGSVLMLGLGLVFRPRRRASQSRLDGQLVKAMRSYHGTRV